MALFENEVPLFPTDYKEIIQRIHNIDPVKYGSSRNFIDGAVTYLSPYISRGVISTKQVLESVLERGYRPAQFEKFIQELAWRDYWQQVWIAKGDAINSDLKNTQTPVSNHEIPAAIVSIKTGIEAIDKAIQEFYQTGYFHNHVRMYIAAITTNMGQSHWKYPAQWMYYHLLDGDWASNALSWQWVAGANSNKKYLANQDYINKYCHTQQKNTFLDVDYSAFSKMEIPEILSETTFEKFTTPLPSKSAVRVNPQCSTFIYNFYNLDPNWKQETEANRILLLEPSIFEQYPISKKSVDFMLDLSQNIEGIQVYVGEFDELVREYDLDEICYKEHPLNTNYKGIEESRDWMFDVQGYFSSFFGFWKKCKKQLKY
ncbi:deoxyribodipyrimidine photolyase [Maribacter algarum]|uniref:Deoxyribodipyrimidine photolyase n=1 Tax=Maribacter algarum (ex Zhang et al. 2020) TaxID=2578118 RepID=A0A5S3PWH2_9FLAO|nr:FAD-binding domain-containing protein [Maribacter algarum]TMM59323.1 deoxyribodipyrimidine photolyase [Maribacter algarum]